MQDTGGTYGVALNDKHLEELVNEHAPPPPARAADAAASLVPAHGQGSRAGFTARLRVNEHAPPPHARVASAAASLAPWQAPGSKDRVYYQLKYEQVCAVAAAQGASAAASLGLAQGAAPCLAACEATVNWQPEASAAGPAMSLMKQGGTMAHVSC